MLCRTTKQARLALKRLQLGKTPRVVTTAGSRSFFAARANAQNVKSHEDEPEGNQIFQYHWGTWMNNDAAEKQKRVTKFSIPGLKELSQRLATLAKEKAGEIQAEGNVKVLAENLGDFTDFQNITRVVSIHEGSSHHVYLIHLDNGRSFIMRLPFALYPKYYTERNVNSEVATSEYLRSELGLKVPKVFAYSGSFDNSLGFPFVMTEYIEGELLMKDWYPLADGALSDQEVINKLKGVIDPVFGFFKTLSQPTFTGYGSLYFKEDYPEGKSAIEGNYKYVLGPTTLKPFYEDSDILSQEEIDQHVGPWAADEPLKVVGDLAKLKVKAVEEQLEKKEKGLGDQLQKQLTVYKNLLSASGKLFDLKQSGIPKFSELVKPRLVIADLDPMNVIVAKDGEYFVDFEDSTVIPFVLSSAPKFVEYDGPKVFDLNEVPDFDKMQEDLKDQYRYMQKRTRNQALWEKELVSELNDLAVAAAPAVKKVRECFQQALKDKKQKNYLNVQSSLAELQQLWKSFSDDHIVGDGDCPVLFNEQDIQQFKNDFQEYQKKLSSSPFAATDGWVPQDVFEKLSKMGVIEDHGDHYELNFDKLVGNEEKKEA